MVLTQVVLRGKSRAEIPLKYASYSRNTKLSLIVFQSAPDQGRAHAVASAIPGRDD